MGPFLSRRSAVIQGHFIFHTHRVEMADSPRLPAPAERTSAERPLPSPAEVRRSTEEREPLETLSLATRLIAAFSIGLVTLHLAAAGALPVAEWILSSPPVADGIALLLGMLEVWGLSQTAWARRAGEFLHRRFG